MRVAAWMLMLGLGVVAIAAGVNSLINEAHAQAPRPVLGISSPNGLIALSDDRDDNHQQITLVDPQQQKVAVYHVERLTGKITLMSVRNVREDLLVDEFNGTSPSPREIRQLLKQ